MNTKYKYIIGLFLIFAILSGCNLVGSLGDIQPHYKLEEDNVIVDERSAASAVRGVYESWRNFEVSLFRPLMSIRSGGLVRIGSLAGEEGFIANDIKPENATVANAYKAFYRTINAANFIIESLEQDKAKGLSESRKNEMLAECHYHRAMSSFHLLRLWGQFYDLTSRYGIVLRDRPYRSLEPASRATVAESYDFILADLDFAIQHGPVSVDRHYYVSRTTARALKARVLLSMRDYVGAAALAKEVIDEAEGQGYVLEDDYAAIFVNGYHSPEVLFGTYTYGWDESNETSIERTTFSNYTKRIADALVGNPDDGDVDTGEGLDSRFASTFLLAQADLNGNGKYPYAAWSSEQRNSYIFLRLGEVYFIHAEAEARNKNYTAARSSLEIMARRAKLPANTVSNLTDSQLLEAIRQQKWIELLSENYEEWFDYVRYYSEGNIQISETKVTLINERQLVLPIPQTALAGNNKLEPNP